MLLFEFQPKLLFYSLKYGSYRDARLFNLFTTSISQASASLAFLELYKLNPNEWQRSTGLIVILLTGALLLLANDKITQLYFKNSLKDTRVVDEVEVNNIYKDIIEKSNTVKLLTLVTIATYEISRLLL